MAYLKGSTSSESLYGTSSEDLIDALAGNDTLYGYEFD
jgi:Ca2+-binding RTX toxin-like protein|tara:strand:- start:675 stop:788 length:114 start_codon:yes stop_codon:yes gene_type:complete